MYAKPLILFSLFVLMLLISTIPVKDEPVLFMTQESGGNAIKELDLNLESQDVAISFLELNSGESTLLQDSKGESVLINTGSLESKTKFKQQMKIFKVNRIESLVLTNIGKQYTGNLSWLLKEKEIERIYIAENIYDDFMEKFEVNEEVVQPLKVGGQMLFFNKVKFKVAYIESRREYNLGGLALIVNYGAHQFLYMGVSNKEAESALIKSGPLDVSLLKVGGFGHYFGTNEDFLDHIKPEVAVIFKREGYTASDEVLNRLDDHWVEVLKPFEQGIVMVKCNVNTYEITQVPLTTPEMAFENRK